MDPTAWPLAIKAVAEMITEIVKGQPIDVKHKIWERWERHQERLDKFFGIEDDEPKKPKGAGP